MLAKTDFHLSLAVQSDPVSSLLMPRASFSPEIPQNALQDRDLV